MTMTPKLRKFALTAHITASVGLLGAIAGFIALAITGLTSQDAEMARAAYLAMELIAWCVIVPLAVGSLLTGVVQAVGTPWGLFRHWWVVGKLLLTVFATCVLLLKMPLISYVADAAAETVLSKTDLRQQRIELLFHACGGLLVLLVPLALSVYKPQGLTRFGRRRQREPRPVLLRPHADLVANASVRPNDGSTASTQRWKYMLGLAVIVVVMHFLVLHLIGGFPHGH